MMLRNLKRANLRPRQLTAPALFVFPRKQITVPSIYRALSTGAPSGSSTPDPIKIDKPTYQLTFTCKKCSERSSHLVSKQAYHSGTVLIQCPSCKNRHLIADHLKVFGDGPKSLEDILADRGEKITKASLDGDLQWEPEGALAEADPHSVPKLGAEGNT